MKIIIIILSLIAIPHCNLYTQETWLHLWELDGILPSKNTYCIVKDSSNNLWFGTSGGLAKFKLGSSFYDMDAWAEFEKNDSTLLSNIIRSVCFDDSNNIWIATQSGGLTKYDGKTMTLYNYYNSGIPSPNLNYVTYHDSKIWVCTDSKGLGIFDGQNWKNYHSGNSLLSNQAYHINFDSSGNAWICTFGGLAKLMGDSIHVFDKTNSGLNDNWIHYIEFDNDGVAWIGTESSVVKYDGETWEVFEQINYNAVEYAHQIVIDKDNVKWFAIKDFAAKFDGENWEVFKKGSKTALMDNHIRHIYIDEFNNKWITTVMYGISLYNENGVVLDVNDNSKITFSDIIIYPNPNNGKFKIGFQDEPPENIAIFNILGQQVFSSKIYGEYIEVNLETEGSGLFIIKTMKENKITTKYLLIN